MTNFNMLISIFTLIFKDSEDYLQKPICKPGMIYGNTSKEWLLKKENNLVS